MKLTPAHRGGDDFACAARRPVLCGAHAFAAAGGNHRRRLARSRGLGGGRVGLLLDGHAAHVRSGVEGGRRARLVLRLRGAVVPRRRLQRRRHAKVYTGMCNESITRFTKGVPLWEALSSPSAAWHPSARGHLNRISPAAPRFLRRAGHVPSTPTVWATPLGKRAVNRSPPCSPRSPAPMLKAGRSCCYRRLAVPASATRPSGATRMLAAFRSRWMRPLACM